MDVSFPLAPCGLVSSSHVEFSSDPVVSLWPGWILFLHQLVCISFLGALLLFFISFKISEDRFQDGAPHQFLIFIALKCFLDRLSFNDQEMNTGVKLG